MSKIASRTRSEVGRTLAPTGRGQAPSPVLPTDHTHRSTLPAHPRPRPVGPARPAGSSAAGAGQLLNRNSASSSSTNRRSSSTSSRWSASRGSAPTSSTASERASTTRSRSESSRASFRSERPFCRAPRMRALPPQLEVDVGQHEPVGARLHGRQAGGGLRARRTPDNRKHHAGSPPRPTRPRSWWSWAMPNRSASSMTMTDASGTSTPTSMTVVATSTSSSPDAERLHGLLLVGRAHLAVQEADPQPGQLVRRPAARPRRWPRPPRPGPNPRPAGRPRRPGDPTPPARAPGPRPLRPRAGCAATTSSPAGARAAARR